MMVAASATGIFSVEALPAVFPVDPLVPVAVLVADESVAGTFALSAADLPELSVQLTKASAIANDSIRFLIKYFLMQI